MRPRDRELAAHLCRGLDAYERHERPLPGIAVGAAREVLIEQFLSSVHRVEYAKRLTVTNLSPCRMDPKDDRFDPLKAAVLHSRAGNSEEAFWLVFLSVHFGKHGAGGWRYLREVYGRLGAAQRWDWARVSEAPEKFRSWLDAHKERLRRKGVAGGFGNHRKYESLDGLSPNGTGAVVASYVRWVLGSGSHSELVKSAMLEAKGNGRRAFDVLYRAMAASVLRFGRLARFDYLAMLGKLGLAGIEPGSTYLNGATGPLRGARLLFGVTANHSVLNGWLGELDDELQVGMQVMEDALCNWQKSPSVFEPFRG